MGSKLDFVVIEESIEMEKLFQTWLDSQTSLSTRKAYESSTKLFFKEMFGIHPTLISESVLNDITPSNVYIGVISPLRVKGMKDSTIRNHIRRVGVFIKYLRDNNIFPNVNFEKILTVGLSLKKLKKDAAKTVPMYHHEYLAFKDWLHNRSYRTEDPIRNIRWEMLAEFMFKTGLRSTVTFKKLTWNHILRERDAGGAMKHFIRIKDKGDKLAVKQLQQSYYCRLKELLYNGRDDELVFQGLSQAYFGELIQEYNREKGLDSEHSFSIHSLRAGGGSWLYAITKDIVQVQQFLNHESPETTRGYIGLDYNGNEDGSLLMTSDIDISKLKDMSKDELLDILGKREDLAYSVMLESLEAY